MKKESEDVSKKVVVILLVIAVILSVASTLITLTKESKIEPPTSERPASVSRVGSVSFVINPPIRDKASVGFTVSK